MLTGIKCILSIKSFTIYISIRIFLTMTSQPYWPCQTVSVNPNHRYPQAPDHHAPCHLVQVHLRLGTLLPLSSSAAASQLDIYKQMRLAGGNSLLVVIAATCAAMFPEISKQMGGVDALAQNERQGYYQICRPSFRIADHPNELIFSALKAFDFLSGSYVEVAETFLPAAPST
jgi:hypothetical protein